jgi:hypothetical protein
MTQRPAQTDCRYEPSYPDHHTVCFIQHGLSDMIMHNKSDRCKNEYPHTIAECGEFDERIRS